MSPISLTLILVSTTISALAQCFFKVGVSSAGVRQAMENGSVTGQVVAYMMSPPILLGIGMYGFGTILWLGALSRVELSLAYPFVGLGFILTALIGYFLFNDHFGAGRMIGTLLVIAGVYMVARG